MTLTYVQSTGELIGLPDGKVTGYSGHPPHVNDVDAEALHDVGPIPAGRWIVGAPIDHAVMGPLAIALTPAPGNVAHGRAGFFIHGESKFHPGEASHGCIILPRGARAAIIDQGVTEIEVVAHGKPAVG